MTREDVIRIALEVGFYDGEVDKCQLMLERFAYLVAQQEREACAELCEMLDVANPKGKSWDEGTIDCANAIRAKGQA
jgi:hypothetical protein